MSDDEREVAEDPPAPDTDTPVTQTQFKALMYTLGTLRKEINPLLRRRLTLFHAKSRKRRTGTSLRREGINCNLNLTMRFWGKSRSSIASSRSYR